LWEEVFKNFFKPNETSQYIYTSFILGGMMLKVPRDIKVLQLLKVAHNPYQVAKEFGDHYASARKYIQRLEKMGLVRVVRTGGVRGLGKVHFYRTTAKGLEVLEGCEHFLDREEEE